MLYPLTVTMIFVGLVLLSAQVLLPGCFRYWQKWKETGRSIFLSHATLLGSLALLVLITLSWMFLRHFIPVR